MNGTQIVSSPGFRQCADRAGRSSAPATSTATARPTFSGVTADGDVAIWLMNGTQILVRSGSRQCAHQLDDRRDRRLQRRRQERHSLAWPDGDVAIWFMNGTQIVSGPDFINVPTSWTIQGANAD